MVVVVEVDSAVLSVTSVCRGRRRAVVVGGVAAARTRRQQRGAHRRSTTSIASSVAELDVCASPSRISQRRGGDEVLEAVHRDLHPALHAGLDVAVAVLLGDVADERRHRRDAVDLVERDGVEGRHVVGVVHHAERGEPLERLGGDDPVWCVDLLVHAVEADLDVALLDDVAPRAADAEVDVADLPDRRCRSPTSA